MLLQCINLNICTFNSSCLFTFSPRKITYIELTCSILKHLGILVVLLYVKFVYDSAHTISVNSAEPPGYIWLSRYSTTTIHTLSNFCVSTVVGFLFTFPLGADWTQSAWKCILFCIENYCSLLVTGKRL